MHGTGGGCCARSRGIVGERKSLNTLQKQTLQSSMAYSDAFTMKLLEIQPTRLLLNVNRIGYVASVPLPRPSPQSHQSLPSPDLLHGILLISCSSCFSQPEHTTCK